MENNQRSSFTPEASQSSQINQINQTAGVGQSDLNNQINQPEQADSPKIDEKAWESALELSVPAGLPKPEIFSNAVGQSETSSETLAEASTKPASETPKESPISSPNPFEKANTQELGKITPLETASQPLSRPSHNQSNIRTSGDHLEKSSIVEIDNALNELNQTGNLNNFYEEIRSMTETNLNNSFNRKLYHDGMEPAPKSPQPPLGGGN